jgi:hypothetical protein
VDKFNAKLTCYEANKLSHAGRLALIKSVFASIPVYYMSSILLSKKILAKLTSIVCKFWWTGIQSDTNSKPLCFRSWFDICQPIQDGRLGVRDLLIMNKSLLAMSIWRIIKEPDSVLACVFKSKYFPTCDIWRSNHSLPKSGFWSMVLNILPQMEDSC